jgi:hypothetical protein
LNQQQNDLSFKMSGKKKIICLYLMDSLICLQLIILGLKIYLLYKMPGTITTKGSVSILLSSKIRNIDTNAPLLALQKIKPSEMHLFRENS